MRRLQPTSDIAADTKRPPKALGLVACLMLIVAVEGCDNSPSVEAPDKVTSELPLIASVENPEFWIFNSNKFQTIRLALNISEEFNDAILNGDAYAPMVAVLIQPLDDPDGDSIVAQLRDDGGYFALVSPAEYLDRFSGDMVPHDLVYSVRINSNFALQAGDYLFTYAAGDLAGTIFAGGGSIESDDFATFTDTAFVADDNPPEIVSFEVGDSLFSGFEDVIWTATVFDADTVELNDEVVSVELALLHDENELRAVAMIQIGGASWTYTATSSFAAGLVTDSYSLRIDATDRYGRQAAPLTATIWMENTAPELSDLIAPDTVYAPATGSNLYDVFIDVDDPQSPSDIETVYFTVIDPNGTSNSNPDWTFRNDGLEVDEIANDATWSQRIEVLSSNTNFGEYRFRFFARDRAGNLSEPIEKAIVMLGGGI